MKPLRETDREGPLPPLPENFVHIPGLDENGASASSYEAGAVLEQRFPGQDCHDLTSALYHNGEWTYRFSDISSIVMEQQGENETRDWVWTVRTKTGTYQVQGGCDYTGWDCQSWVTVTLL